MFRAAATRRTRLLTTNLVLAETHRLLLHRAGMRPAAWALDRFEASALLTITFTTAEHHRAARAWLERLADQSITYTDAVSFAVMDATGCSAAMSFDHDFLLAGFSLWFG
jgi:predicted nucleic acid-binding protein